MPIFSTVLSFLSDFLRRFGRVGFAASFVLGSIVLVLVFNSDLFKSQYSFEERVFFVAGILILTTFFFIRTLFFMGPVKKELYAQFPITTLDIVKSKSANIDFLYLGSENGMRKVAPWSVIYPQFISLTLNRVYYEPSIADLMSTNSTGKVLGVRYKDGKFQFVRLSMYTIVYDAVQFATACVKAGIPVAGQYESMKDMDPLFTPESKKRLIIIVAVGLILYVVGMILLYLYVK